MQTSVNDKNKILTPDIVEREIDIETIDDGPHEEFIFVVEQEELIIGEPHS